jgi:hypothetical protein
MKIELKSLESWLKDLADVSKPFSFSRWGDGEWRAVLSPGGNSANCDGHKFFPAMGDQLRQILCNKPTYRIGMQSLAVRLFAEHIANFLEKAQLTALQWYDSDVFHKGAIYGKMDQILQAMSSRKVLLIGPRHLAKVPFPCWKQIFVPSTNVYLQLDSILRQVDGLLAGKDEPLLISISASMPAEIMVDRLHKKYGHLHTIVDFGSLWDPLVGVKSRSYMKDPAKFLNTNKRA